MSSTNKGLYARVFGSSVHAHLGNGNTRATITSLLLIFHCVRTGFTTGFKFTFVIEEKCPRLVYYGYKIYLTKLRNAPTRHSHCPAAVRKNRINLGAMQPRSYLNNTMLYGFRRIILPMFTGNGHDFRFCFVMF